MKLEPVNYQDPYAPEQFVACLREYGFGVLTQHPLAQTQIESIYQNWLAFFKTEQKYQYHFKKGCMDGYFPPDVSETAKGYDIKDIKEYFHFYHPWGCCPDSLRNELLAYRDAANQVAETLLGWVETYSPPHIAKHYSEPLSAMIADSNQTLLRVLHYPPMTGHENPQAFRAAAHEDINLLTILPSANEPGLQVQLKDGSWLDVPCDTGYLIVNIGDMLQEASSGYFPSTTHRVLMPPPERQNRSRLALPLFLHPRPDVVLSKRYTADSYLKERLRELGVA